MDKQTTIAFVLIGLVLVAWLYLNSPQQTPEQKQKIAHVQDSIANAKKVALEKAAEQEAQKVLAENAEKQTDTTAKPTGSALLFPAFTGTEKVITIDNDVARFELSNHGAKIRRVYLKKYNNWYSAEDKQATNVYQSSVLLVDAANDNDLDISFETGDRKLVSSGNLAFATSENRDLISVKGADSVSVDYKFITPDNRTITKRFTFYGSRYDSHLTIGLQNIASLIANGMYELNWNAGVQFVERNSVDEANFANSSAFHGGEQVKVDAPKKDKIEKDFSGRVDWLCFRNKYFAAVVSPDKPEEIDGAHLFGEGRQVGQDGMVEHYQGNFRIPVKDANYSASFLIYTGPVKYNVLKEYNRNFDKIVDFGSFLGLSFIVRPIAEYIFLPLFTFLYGLIGNYGIVILLFSIIVKFILQPLSKQSLTSMQKMQALQPKLTEIKEKYKDDPTKVNKETMKLYSTYGINPAGGCLPMLLQMPIFVALWGMFQTAIDLRQQPFIFWIKDLSQPDTILYLPFKIPLFGVSQLSALALMMGVTTFVQQKMSVKDPSQKAMVYMMPVMLTFLFMSFPAGLNLYYFLFNVLSIGQQYYMSKYSKSVELIPVTKGSQKKGFMERMMEAAEAKTQQQGQAKKKK
jgi:YidC/Oxa1 family membrane protein insertase